MEIHTADHHTDFAARSSSTFLNFSPSTALLTFFLAVSTLFTTLCTLTIYRLVRVLTRPKPYIPSRSGVTLQTNQVPDGKERRHLVIVLGSGGHTTEMLSILQNLGAEYLNTRFAQRTWVVSSGDAFSAERARVFEEKLAGEWAGMTSETGVRNTSTSTVVSMSGADVRRDESEGSVRVDWDIATVRRARKVHQPLYTTPFSALVCLWECIRVLRRSGVSDGIRTGTATSRTRARARARVRSTPDLVLTNGPGTGVIIVLASIVLLALGLAPLQGKGSMRSVYIESWARVKTLSLSGKILRWMVSRFLVQWRSLADYDATTGVAVVGRHDGGGKKGGTGEQGIGKEGMGDIDTRQTTMARMAKETEIDRSHRRRIEYVGAVVT